MFNIAFCICCYPQLLCQEILKELNCLEKPRDHKAIDIWLLMLIYSNSESLQKSIEKMFKKKIIEDCIQEVMLDQCICGNKELVQVSMTIIWFKEYFTSILYVLKLYLRLIKFRRIIFHCFFRCLSTCWLPKNKKQGSLAFTCILVCLKSSLTLIQDRK